MSVSTIPSNPLVGLKASVVYDRRKAAGDLANAAESSKDIVLALMVAKESDTDQEVRTLAAQALQAPVHQNILKQNPDLPSQVAPAVQKILADRNRLQVQTSQPRRTGYWSTRRIGFSFLALGVISFILPLIHYRFMLFYVIPTDNPIVGVILLLIGAGLLFSSRGQ